MFPSQRRRARRDAPYRFLYFLHAEQEPWRRQHGDHRLCDAILETLARLMAIVLRDGNQTIERSLIDRTPECSGRKVPQNFLRVLAPLFGAARNVLGEEQLEVL